MTTPALLSLAEIQAIVRTIQANACAIRDELSALPGFDIPNGAMRQNDPMIDEDVVKWEGDEYWAFGGHEHYEYSLPLDICVDPAAAREYVAQEQAHYQRKRELAEVARRAQEQRKEQDERAELAKLKAKYEGAPA